MARVLVVEDNEAFAWTIRTMFLEHHTVTVVGSVAACSDLEHPFDVGLVDYDLPDGKGVEVVRTLLRRQPELPLVAISAHATGNAALRAAGARETCPKAEMHRIAVVLDDLLVASRPMDTTEPKTRVMAAMQGAAMLQLAFAGVAGRLLGALAEEDAARQRRSRRRRARTSATSRAGAMPPTRSSCSTRWRTACSR